MIWFQYQYQYQSEKKHEHDYDHKQKIYDNERVNMNMIWPLSLVEGSLWSWHTLTWKGGTSGHWSWPGKTWWFELCRYARHLFVITCIFTVFLAQDEWIRFRVFLWNWTLSLSKTSTSEHQEVSQNRRVRSLPVLLLMAEIPNNHSLDVFENPPKNNGRNYRSLHRWSPDVWTING